MDLVKLNTEKFKEAAAPTDLEVGDECEVTRTGYTLPRIARITKIDTDGAGVTYYDVEWLSHMEHVYYQHETAEDKAEDEAEDVDGESGECNVRADRVSARACDILALFTKEEMLQYKAWRCLVEILVLLQPSSAAAERVFSLLTTLFSKAQRSTLQKFIFTAIAQRMHDR